MLVLTGVSQNRCINVRDFDMRNSAVIIFSQASMTFHTITIERLHLGTSFLALAKILITSRSNLKMKILYKCILCLEAIIVFFTLTAITFVIFQKACSKLHTIVSIHCVSTHKL